MSVKAPSRRIGSHDEATSSLFSKSWKAAWHMIRIERSVLKPDKACRPWPLHKPTVLNNDAAAFKPQ
jgi:hypothetical protein